MSDISDYDDYFNYYDNDHKMRQLDLLNSEMDKMKYQVTILLKKNTPSDYMNCFGIGFSLSLGVCTSVAILSLVMRRL
jgi:uncharacterized protein YfaP (DUF2135 family)